VNKKIIINKNVVVDDNKVHQNKNYKKDCWYKIKKYDCYILI